MNIFTFWEGRKPAYIELCMETWKLPYTELTYENVNEYTDLDVELIKKFTLPHQADIVRAHVLRDQGGYWLDADTIMLTGNLPDTDMVGDPVKKTNTIGLLYSEPHSDMFEEWAEYQDEIIKSPPLSRRWSLFGNEFTDGYVRKHNEIRIHDVTDYWPETYMVGGSCGRFEKYREFYFANSYHLSDIRPTDLIMLHNSWVPGLYKEFTKKQVHDCECTLSNILREALPAW